MGVGRNTVIAELLVSGKYRLLPIPYGEALRRKYLLVSEYTIPAGTYRSVVPTKNGDWLSQFFFGSGIVVPPQDIQTIAVKAKLLTHKEVDPRLVAAVTNHVLNEDFQRENRLEELFSRNRAERIRFAEEKPEFVIHPGAMSVYHPEEFDLGRFESFEALYSLIASLAIATFIGIRTFIRSREKKRGHRLDGLIRQLLDIEERQLTLDTGPGKQHESQLQEILDEVTALRMQAIASFSAHELKDDPSGQFFIELCHSLSNKVNAKVSRQRSDTRFDELIETLRDEK